MMKKLSLLSLLVLLIGINSFAQSSIPCGFDIVHNERMRTDVNYEKAVREVNNRWIKYSTLMSSALLTYTPSGYVYEIPMVIHVIHTGGAIGTKYNIDSTKIAQMVDYLNKSYAAVSPFPDTTAGGCRIPLKFVLAKRSPSGAATNGVVRIDGTLTYSNYDAFGINANSSSGIAVAQAVALSRWNPSDYYNVYVVNKIDGNDLYTTGGIAGFAYYPGTPTVDGMYVAASQVKSGSTTVSHEFGHAFSLAHTFEGDAGGTTCPPTSPCSTTGDLVCDTEPHIRSASSPGWCPATDANPCTGGLSYKNVQNNIMDYTNCPPNRYTAGQRARVLNTLDNERTGYKSSFGLLAPTGTVVAACIPTSALATGSFGPYIVTFNGLEVWTGNLGQEALAYVDHSYTQQSYVERGVSYPISVTTRTNRQNVKVYIDYNNDGDFADAGENVFNHTGTTSGTEVHTGSFTIPTTVTTCNWLRMRVVAASSSASIADYACGPYANNAQAEDYAVYVKDRTAVDTVTIAQTFGTNPSCTGASVTFTATPKAGTPTYRWYINGTATSVTTSTYTSTTLANNDIITCKTYFTGACGSDSAVSNGIQLKVSSTALASAKNTLIAGAIPGCAGQPLVFKTTVSGGGSAPIYSWRRNGIIVGANVDTFASSSLVAGDKIWCRVTPNSICSTTPVNSDTITITFGTTVPSNNITLISGTIPSCDSTSLTFQTNITNGGTAPSIQWYVNNTIVAGATGIYYTNAALKNGDSVQCRIISNHVCIVPTIGDTAWSNKIYVVRDPRTIPTLSVALTAGKNPGCLGDYLEYTATATDGGGSPLVIWYVNNALVAYGSVYGSAAFADGDILTCKMLVTPASCNTVDSLDWGPTVLVRSTKPTAVPTVSLIGTLLVSSIPTGIQWYGPTGLIPGATGPTYHPTTTGSFYARVINGACEGDSSNTLNIALLSISPYNMSNVKIFPNPSTGLVNLDWGTEKINGSVDVFTVTGQRISTNKIENKTTQVLDLSKIANGNYFIVIRNENNKVGTVAITIAH